MDIIWTIFIDIYEFSRTDVVKMFVLLLVYSLPLKSFDVWFSSWAEIDFEACSVALEYS
jgi:hypothetical protein